MTPIQYLKRLVLIAFIIRVTSHPTSPYGNRLINFLEGTGASGGSSSSSTNGRGRSTSNGISKHVHSSNCDLDRRRYHQKNLGSGSDSSSLEISFQPLRELESVSAPSSSSSSPLYPPLTAKQNLVDGDVPITPSLTFLPNLSAALRRHNQMNFYRQRRTNHRPPNDEERHRSRYPDESFLPSSSSIEDPSSSSIGSVVNGLNEIPLPVEDDDIVESVPILGLDYTHHNPKPASNQHELELEDNDADTGNDGKLFKRQQHPFSLATFADSQPSSAFSYLDDEANSKRNALVAFKRQKSKTHQTQFIPSVSVGAMTNLGDFFKHLRNNVDFMEKQRLSNTAEQLLEGDHPMQVLKEELASSEGAKPTGTAAFLHAIRNYRPSQRIRSLVALNPEGYHGSQFLDPNYMWVGLGK